jgi:hypothetical protein
MKALLQQRHCRVSAANHSGSVFEQNGCKSYLSKSPDLQLQYRGCSRGQVGRRHGARCQQKPCQTSRILVQSSAQTASVSTPEAIKTALFEALEGTDRGIYGVPVTHMSMRGACTFMASQPVALCNS